MDFSQGEFAFDQPGIEEGYRKWQKQLDEKRKEIESRFGIVLGSRVKVQLIGELKPLEGIITLPSANAPLERGKLKLILGHRQFLLSQIESISVIR